MAQMTFRMTEEVEQALSELTDDKHDRSEVIRGLILEASKERRQALLREDAERLSNDPAYLAEVKAVRSELDDISAW